jgi:hypothetical protein
MLYIIASLYITNSIALLNLNKNDNPLHFNFINSDLRLDC